MSKLHGQSRFGGTAFGVSPFNSSNQSLFLCPLGTTSFLHSPGIRSPSWCAAAPGTARPLPRVGIPKTSDASAVRSSGSSPGSSFRIGVRSPPRPPGLSLAEPPPGRISISVRPRTGSPSGSAAVVKTAPPSGRCSAGRTACLHFPMAGKSCGIRSRSGGPVRLANCSTPGGNREYTRLTRDPGA